MTFSCGIRHEIRSGERGFPNLKGERRTALYAINPKNAKKKKNNRTLQHKSLSVTFKEKVVQVLYLQTRGLSHALSTWIQQINDVPLRETIAAIPHSLLFGTICPHAAYFGFWKDLVTHTLIELDCCLTTNTFSYQKEYLDGLIVLGCTC